LEITPIVKNFYTGKKFYAQERSYIDKVYMCIECSNVFKKVYSMYGDEWISFEMNLDEYIKNYYNTKKCKAEIMK
jgi:hypothetical protein